MLFLIRFYQRWLSPILGPSCRFYPSCSNYALTCYKKHSFLRATYRVALRLSRCHPLNPGGVDLP